MYPQYAATTRAHLRVENRALTCSFTAAGGTGPSGIPNARGVLGAPLGGLRVVDTASPAPGRRRSRPSIHEHKLRLSSLREVFGQGSAGLPIAHGRGRARHQHPILLYSLT